MIKKPLRVIILLALATLFVTPSVYHPARASSAGPDTISLNPADVIDSTLVTGSTFTQDVSISYSCNTAGQCPIVLALQYGLVYKARVLALDMNACQTVSGIVYCGVIPSAATVMCFPLEPIQVRVKSVGSNNTFNELIVSSIASLNLAVGCQATLSTVVHSTIHWKVTGIGRTVIDMVPIDTFYITTTTSPIDPQSSTFSGQVFYARNRPAPLGFFQNGLLYDINCSIAIPQTPDHIQLTKTFPLVVRVTNTGDFDVDVSVVTSVNGTAYKTTTIHVPEDQSPLFQVNSPTTVVTHLVFSVTCTILGTFGDPTPLDNTATWLLKVTALPVHPADLTGKGAWPDHHHFSISHYGSTEILFAKVATTGTAYIYVSFTLVKDTVPIPSVSTVPFLCKGPTGTVCEVSFGFGPLSPLTDIGHYDVTATAWYSDDNINFLAGVSTKAFTFAVLP
jgi:hypothetical protein